MIPKIETAWGTEYLIYGTSLKDKYTCKILSIKKGGCLSLQKHQYKTETWVCLSGKILALLIINGKVVVHALCTNKIMHVPAKSIHRLIGLDDNSRIFEVSTLDKHSANNTHKKDIIRYDCIYGRPVSRIKGKTLLALVEEAKIITANTLNKLNLN